MLTQVKRRYQVMFEVTCDPNNIETVARGMLHSLYKDGWPQMLYGHKPVSCKCGHLPNDHSFPTPPYRIHQVGAPCSRCDCKEYEE